MEKFYDLKKEQLKESLYNLVKQVVYVDNVSASGSLTKLRKWWSLLVQLSPQYGCYVNVAETHLILKKMIIDVKDVFNVINIYIINYHA